MRLVIDTFEFGSKFTPRFNTISISGYHIREAGSTALQELAFTLYDGVEYVEWARRRGLDVDEFGPRLSFFFNAHNDFFEEIAKYRAARKIWYRVMKDRFGAKNQRTWLMRFHTQTAGVSLPAQQPMNNIARVALQALAAVLGGTQSLHTDSYDEALALPTEEAARIALRTQQIIAYESGVTQTVDPLGGSYFVENQTLQMENGAFDYFGKLDAMGGMVKAIERGYPQKEIAESSYQYQRAVEAREKIIVGVNEFVIEEESPHILYIDETVARQQSAKLKTLRSRRSNEEVQRALDALKKAAAQEPKAGSMAASLPPTRCPTSWTPSAPTPPSAKSAKPCGRCTARTRKSASRRQTSTLLFQKSPLKPKSGLNGPPAPLLTLQRYLAFSGHSFRSATMGSTPAARRAGIADASSAARPSIRAASASITGSHGLTPNS